VDSQARFRPDCVYGQVENAENEVFSRMVEDPLVYIKQMELSKRHEAETDPAQLQKVR